MEELVMSKADWSAEERERYSRHFALSELGEEGQRKLMNGKVLVIGAGGLGSPALTYLAAAGVGTIGICDGDKVDISNLQRQILYTEKDLGVSKTEAAARKLREINAKVDVRQFPRRASAQNIDEMIADFDIVIDAVDTFGAKLLINDACVRAKKPFVHAGIIRMEGQLMTYVPGCGPCLRCIMGHAPEEGTYPTGKSHGVLGASVGILGAMEAQEAIKYLTGMGRLMTGRMFFMDGLTMEVQIQDMGEKNPHCPVCGE